MSTALQFASQPPAPPTPSDADVRDAVTHALEQLRQWTLSRVQRVNAFTATETLAAGDALSSIVTESRAYVDAVRASLASVAGSGGDGDAIGQIEAQRVAVDRYLADAAQSVARQDRIAREAVAELAAARKLGGMLASISSDARLLAINARIEAAHIRQAIHGATNGAAFEVIAAEMSNFARAVHTTNEEIVGIVEHLAQTVQEVADGAAVMRRDSEHFSDDYTRRAEHVSELVRELRGTVTDALSQGDVRMAKVIQFSHEALSHLQFQDACAQQLLQIDADIGGVQSVVEKALRGEITSELVAADSHRVLSAGHVAVFDDDRAASDDSPAVGDVLLF